ncbi:MAG: TPM domain-containing protein [Clostridium celatum]|uniref:TPM domain-containing protein n=1 Tax=uncultured Clostridium sp. TaxID=59620 RepID=UPI0025F829C2|nr:TPM domain-containing protein [uncultured Clostridium sp.]MDU4884224.1 TPM domain-containing protein [Clostridium celatum]MDU5260957.1 TPM domain-containing protein [Clostridium celatum]MDU7077433.1 TPM domain-containing protein [Clostridium celatum]
MKGLKKKVIPCISIVIFILSFNLIVKAHVNPVVDDAKLLSQDEAQKLREDIENFREKYNMDAVIVTSKDLEGKSTMDYADDYYDYNGYGLGDNKSGILLLIDMNDRKIWISTSGDAIEYFTDNRIESIISDISKYLSDAEYFDACNIFLNNIQYYIDSGIPEGQYTYSEEEHTLKIVLIALGVAAIVAGVTCIVVVNSYKNSKSVSSINYIDNNSIVFTKRRDIFINTFTTKTKIERNNSSGGNGSSTHRSSSGNTHGGGGGSF